MPVELLKNKNIVQVLVKISYPLIRAVDIFGYIFWEESCNQGRLICSVRMDITHQLFFSHERLSEATGTATAAFVLAFLEGSTMLGVWYPEQLSAGGEVTWRRCAPKYYRSYFVLRSSTSKRQLEESPGQDKKMKRSQT
ncbi:hypothetical protein CASFOL_017765 [Castilleja foliolosa]